MECTRARRFFLVRVIGHDVVEINLQTRDVLLRDTYTSGSHRVCREGMLLLAGKNEANFIVGAKYTKLLSSTRGNGLIVETDQRASDTSSL